MKGLLTKDIQHIRTNFMGAYAYLLLMTVVSSLEAAFGGKISQFPAACAAVTMAIIPPLLMADDVRTGAAVMWTTLPASRRTQVGARYLMVTLHALVVSAAYFLPVWLCGMIGGMPVTDAAAGGLLIAAGGIIYPALSLPFIYGCDTKSTPIVVIISLGVMGAVVGVMLVVMGKNRGYDLFGTAISLAVSLAVAAISYCVSARLYERKDIG